MSKSKREIKLSRIKQKIEKAKNSITSLSEQQAANSNKKSRYNSQYDTFAKLVSSSTQQQHEREKKLDYYRRNALNLSGNGLKASPGSIDQTAQASMLYREQSYAIKSLSRKLRRIKYLLNIKIKLDTRISQEKEKATKRIASFEQKIKIMEIAAQKAKMRSEKPPQEKKTQ